MVDAGAPIATAFVRLRPDAEGFPEELKAKLDPLNVTVNVKVKADTSTASADVQVFKRELDTVPDDKTVKVKADTSDAKKGTEDLRAALLALAPALGPVAAVGAGGAVGLGAAFAGAATGLGAFALVAKTDLGSVTTATATYSKAQQQAATSTGPAYTKALIAEHQALAGLDPAQKAAAASLLQLEAAGQKFSKSFEPQVYGLAAEGASTLGQILPKLTPLVGGTAGALGGLEDKARAALTGPFYDQFLTYASQSAPKAVTALGTAAGDAFTGVLGIVQGLDPLTQRVEGFLDRGAAKFESFGKAVAAGDSPGFERFLTYVETEGPRVEQTVESVASAAVTLGKAFGATAQLELPLIKASADLVTDLGKVSPALLDVAAGAYTLNKALGPLGGIKTTFGYLKDVPGIVTSYSAAVKGGAAATDALSVASKGTALEKLAPLLAGVAGPAGAAGLAVIGLTAALTAGSEETQQYQADIAKTTQLLGQIAVPASTSFTSAADAAQTFKVEIGSANDALASVVNQVNAFADPAAQGISKAFYDKNNNPTLAYFHSLHESAEQYAQDAGALKAINEGNSAGSANPTYYKTLAQQYADATKGIDDLTQAQTTYDGNTKAIAATFGITQDQAYKLASIYHVDLSQSQKEVIVNFGKAATAAQGTAGPFNEAAASAAIAAQQTQDYANALDAVVKIPTDKLAAKVTFQQSLSTTVSGLKSGSSLDTTTAAGQTNASNLIALTKAAAGLAETAGSPAAQAKAFDALTQKINATFKAAGQLTPALLAEEKQLGLTGASALQAAKDSGTLTSAQSAAATQLQKLGVSADDISKHLDGLTLSLAAFVAKASNLGVSAGNAFAEGFDTGIVSGTARAQAVAADLAEKSYAAAKANLRAASPSKRTQELGGWFSEGLGLGIRLGIHDVEKAAVQLTEGALKKQVTSAKDALVTLQQSSTSLQQSVSSSLTSALDITTSLPFAATAPTAATILAGLAGQVADAQTFAGNLGRAKALGLNAGSLSQIAGAGIAGGGRYASALANATPAQIAAVNADEAEIGAFSGQAGQTVADATYGSQISDQTATLHKVSASLDKLVAGQTKHTQISAAAPLQLAGAVQRASTAVARQALAKGFAKTKPKAGKVK